MKKPILSLFLCLIASFLSIAQLTVPLTNPNFPITNGSVNSMVQVGNKMYLGGQFTQIGPNTGGGALLSSGTGLEKGNLSNVNGIVYTSIADGNGGWFIGGLFDSVDHVARMNVAHILPNNVLDLNWAPSVNGTVLALAINGGKLYIGGEFTSVSRLQRRNLAAVDLTTGAVANFNPDPNRRVYALAAGGLYVYVGGEFNSIGAQSTRLVAQIDTNSARATSWNPDAQGTAVLSLLKVDTTLYVGGNFTSFLSVNRSGLAALSTNSLSVSAWNPSVTGTVYSMVLSGDSSVLYFGGLFSSVNSASRLNLAGVSTATAQPTPLNKLVNGQVSVVALRGDTLYAGGTFTAVEDRSVFPIASYERSHIAAFNVTTGALTSWSSFANQWVSAITAGQGELYVGGAFSSIAMRRQINFATFDLQTRRIVPTRLQFLMNNGGVSRVNALVSDGTKIYIGGEFDRALEDGTTFSTRGNLAAVNIEFGWLSSWAPSANNEVMCIALDSPYVYVGGKFDFITGTNGNRENRTGIAKLELATGNIIINWSSYQNMSKLTGKFFSITIDPVSKDLYVGGELRRNVQGDMPFPTGCAKLSHFFGDIVNAFYAQIDGDVYSTKLVNDSLFIAGNFTQVNRVARNMVAKLHPTTASPLTFNPGISPVRGVVKTMEIINNSMYLGGKFVFSGGTSNNNFAHIDLRTGGAITIPPTSDDTIKALLQVNNTLFIAGAFKNFSNRRFEHLSSINICANVPTARIIGDSTQFGCDDGSFYLNAPAGYNYLWSTGDTSQRLQVPATGNYSLRVIVDGCTSKVSKSVLVVLMNPPGRLPLTQRNDTLYVTNRPNLTYQWYLNNVLIAGATSYKIPYVAPNIYKVVYRNQYGCSDTSMIELTTNLAAGYESTIKIYPNPTSGKLTISATDMLSGPVVLFNAMGQVILKADMTSTQEELDLGLLPAGLYWLEVSGKRYRIAKE